MPDITMCSDDGCPLKESCYRHEASGTQVTERFQAWFHFSPRRKGADVCDSYWKVRVYGKAPVLDRLS